MVAARRWLELGRIRARMVAELGSSEVVLGWCRGVVATVQLGRICARNWVVWWRDSDSGCKGERGSDQRVAGVEGVHGWRRAAGGG